MKPRLLTLTLVLLPALACTPTSTVESDAPEPQPVTATAPLPDLAALYAAAVADAELAEADEISDGLVAITPDNPDLKFDDAGRVLVVTWTSWDGYDVEVGQEVPLGVEVWVTPAPQLQTLCKGLGLDGTDLDHRLEQLLGVPPDNGKDRVVQLWVPTDGLFRPSPDPEIDDDVAQLDFPEGTDQAHIDWFEAQRAKSYGEGGYPWTRLGYTYDYAPDASSEVGLSEFVAREGTKAVVESIETQAEYCRPD